MSEQNTSDERTAWLIEDLRPPQPMYAAVNEWGMWYGEWDINNPAVVQFANKASAEAVMRAVKRRDDGYAPSGFHHLQEAREHMWIAPRTGVHVVPKENDELFQAEERSRRPPGEPE